MKIEKGKTYVTKHGKEIEVVYRLHEEGLRFPFVAYNPQTDQQYYYEEDGRVLARHPEDFNWDIVAEKDKYDSVIDAFIDAALRK